MNQKFILSDGEEVLIRDLVPNDLDNLMKFYQALPDEDRRFLRIDVTKREVVEKRLELMKAGGILRIVAVSEENIIADGALELPREDWRRNQAEVRVIVSRPFQRRGLGMFMMRELTGLAREHEVELLVVKMMKPQKAARRVCQKLGFRKKHIIPNYVIDMHGDSHDLLIMTQKVNDVWQDLNNLYDGTDWQRCR